MPIHCHLSPGDCVFEITSCLWQGPFASHQRLPALQAAGITHLLNVGESPNVLTIAEGPFVEIAWHPIADLERIPDAEALKCLDELHRMVTLEHSRVYVHCVAGWNRSATVVWLYLVACGMAPDVAKELIGRRNIDAVPAHPRLVDEALVTAVQRHGKRHAYRLH